MEFSAEQIAAMIKGVVEGDEKQLISDISTIEDAQRKSLTFLSNPKYTEYIYSTGASIAIVAKNFIPEKDLPPQLTLIRVADPYMALAELLQAYASFTKPTPAISKHCAIDETAVIGRDVFIGDFVSIAAGVVIADGCAIYSNTSIGEKVKIGANTVIHSNCSIYRESIIGQDCIFHSGVVIGADGFGFAPNTDGFKKVLQIGNVIIEDNVEIGANSCIDRATLGSTVIRKNVKLDNFIQIAHNVEVGENTMIAAHTGIAGSSKIGKNCLIGGQVGINGHIQVADGTKVAAQSGVASTVKEKNTTLQGTPAFPNGEFKRSYLYFMKLPMIKSKLDQLEKEIKKIN